MWGLAAAGVAMVALSAPILLEEPDSPRAFEAWLALAIGIFNVLAAWWELRKGR